MTTTGPKITKLALVGLYGMVARLGFEWAMPLYALWAFSVWPCVIIWTLFLIWQLPTSIFLVKELKKLDEEAV